MERKDIVKIIEAEKLVLVTRLKDSKQASMVLKSLIDVGVKVMEITSNTPNFEEEITKARKLFPDVLIGAGTVINKEIAKKAINAGAQFIVTPNTDISLIKIAHNNNIPILMGALTPTEVCTASEAGADFVKLFPADIMGVPYFKSIKAPLDKVKLFAVGGIELDSVQDWFNAGAMGIGIASVLQEPDNCPIDLAEVESRIAKFVKHIKSS
ncbi:bifunctional 4-hydroxy-2-oxoglutarate aldolase/2-dehydro-3-deoxy-phosphogluconate aldolase [Lutibacter citreus]|uniref:bifunctional 4-hydroxy-2-oxoglutarate aldolase/2-dehydro-3-deoxy-phosphogluconate aldolase n=1 Tax=Lutibacter citreus TaxID=2138210 RepID=UPI000DBE440E|nr:bifunctional 4-hydroxy-2-oxoglutarate aldolase/2-dehydro-3-deoxy-phosphogluconate aldolase [Lutibacter citreus]